MTTNTQTDLQRAAQEARAEFHFAGADGKGHNGRDVRANIWTTRGENGAEWVRDLCHDAHGDMMPDDMRYAMIVIALNALEEWDDPNDARDCGIEAPIYTHELTEWLHSRADRCSYVDEARTEFGLDADTDTVTALGWGWLMEAWEVFNSVQASLEARVESEADDG